MLSNSVILGLALFGVACFSLGKAAPILDATAGEVSRSVRASEFLLVDSKGRTCARLGLDQEEPQLQLFEPRTGRSQIEVGLDWIGGSQITLRDMCTDTAPGAELVLENQGDPGVPTIRLVGKDARTPTRAELRLAVDTRAPKLVGTTSGGKTQELLGSH